MYELMNVDARAEDSSTSSCSTSLHYSPVCESTVLLYRRAGTGNATDELRFIEESVVVNHSCSILMPKKLELPESCQLDAWDEFGFLDECDMTLQEFCKMHNPSYPSEEKEFHIRPARPDETGMFYAKQPAEDERLGAIGHVRINF